jgi:hypothetical protein
MWRWILLELKKQARKISTKMLFDCCNLIALPHSHAVDGSPAGASPDLDPTWRNDK